MIHAAVAVLKRADGWVLLAERPPGKGWAGWWEFPGGKIEADETALEALQREVKEELGIEVTIAHPWIIRTFNYPEKTVKLHFYVVTQWQGEPQSIEGQKLSWQNPVNLTVTPMLPANLPIIAALALPDVVAITNLAEVGEALFFTQLQAALANGLKLIQAREKHLSAAALKVFAQRVIALAKPYAAQVLINGDIALAREVGAAGVHLPSHKLMQLQVKPEDLLCAASCHNQQELEHAQRLMLDFVLLSPVQPTLSHPKSSTLGWMKFNQMVSNYPLPVYALGGMNWHDKLTAWQHGARGIAMQRAVWRDNY